MTCTEEEARKKWCPMARGIDHSEQCYATPWLPCAASNCMMWRWATEDGATVYLPTSEKWTCEYCDGQGKHEKFIEDDPEQPECRNPEGICLECDGMGSGTKVARAGFCGLGGKP